MNKKLGFTLSEILIALTIIGVVAAIATPRFIGNSTKKQFTAKFKTTLNLLNSAAKEFKMEEGGYDFTGDKSHMSGAINISRILQNKAGAKLITTNTGANKTSSDWIGNGVFYTDNTGEADPDRSDFKITTTMFDKSASGNSFSACESRTIVNDSGVANIPFGCSTTDSNHTYKTLVLPNGAYIFVATNQYGCNFHNYRWTENNITQNSTSANSYLKPEFGPVGGKWTTFNLCLAFVDVNGAKGPNKLTSCVGTTNLIWPDSTATCSRVENSSMRFASVGDIYPIWFYDDSVAPANTAANSVWLDDIND